MSVNLNDWDKESFLPIEYRGNELFKEYLRSNSLDGLIPSERCKHPKEIEYTKKLSDKILEKIGLRIKYSEIKEINKSASSTYSDYSKFKI